MSRKRSFRGYIFGTYPMPDSPTHSNSFLRMCTWRRVRNLYKRCGHAVNLPDEEIKCESAACKFSPAHPKHCLPPNCTYTCWQYHQFPEQYSPHLDKLCPTCCGKK